MRNRHPRMLNVVAVMTYGLLLATLLASGLITSTQGQRTTGNICRIKCGVVTTTEDLTGGRSSWVELVRTAWEDLVARKGIIDVELTFVTVHRRTEFTIDMLIEAYMEIGTSNISAMIGPYVVPLATATEKFGIPYFVTSPLEHSSYRPYNMISVSPDPVDMVQLTTEIARRYQWGEVAVLYDSEEGARLIERLVLLNTLRVRSWKIARNSTEPEVKHTLLAVRNLDVYNMVLFTTRNVAVRVLRGALFLSMLSKDYGWILPNLNLDHRDFDQFVLTQVNFTTFQLVQSFAETRIIPGDFSEFDYATTIDSLLALYHGIHTHYRKRGSCYWTGKNQILRILPKIEDTGATGRLTFRHDGTREGYIIDILGLGYASLIKIGHWNSSEPDPHKRLFINASAIPLRVEEVIVTTTEMPQMQEEIMKVAIVLMYRQINLGFEMANLSLALCLTVNGMMFLESSGSLHWLIPGRPPQDY